MNEDVLKYIFVTSFIFFVHNDIFGRRYNVRRLKYFYKVHTIFYRKHVNIFSCR